MKIHECKVGQIVTCVHAGAVIGRDLFDERRGSGLIKGKKYRIVAFDGSDMLIVETLDGGYRRSDTYPSRFSAEKKQNPTYKEIILKLEKEKS